MTRIRRGVYRLVHYPAGEHEDLAIVWLWCEQAGTFSHQTALALHGLSDILPAEIHLALPLEWRQRRFRVPAGVVLHHLEVPRQERVEITGLRNPCLQLDGLQKGLMAAVLDRDADGNLIRKAGVMSIVVAGGDVRPGDAIAIALPAQPHRALVPV